MGKRFLSLMIAALMMLTMASCRFTLTGQSNTSSEASTPELSGEISTPEPESSTDGTAEAVRKTLAAAQSYIDTGNYELAKQILTNAANEYDSQEITDKLNEVQAAIDAQTVEPSSQPEVSQPEPSSEISQPEESSKPKESSKAQDVDYAKKFVGTYHLTPMGEEEDGEIKIKRKSNTKISIQVSRDTPMSSTNFTKTATVSSKNYFTFTFSDGAVKSKVKVTLNKNGSLTIKQTVLEVLIEGTDFCYLGEHYYPVG